MNNNSVKLVGGHLEGEQLDELETIKTYHGIQRNADLLRMLIREEARRIRQEQPELAPAEVQS